jgi:itaconate CoA-transferase
MDMLHDFGTEYARKLMPPEKAVSLIPEQGNLALGLAANGPPALCAALAERARSGEKRNRFQNRSED